MVAKVDQLYEQGADDAGFLNNPATNPELNTAPGQRTFRPNGVHTRILPEIEQLQSKIGAARSAQ